MVLRNRRGQESKRELRLKVIETEEEGDRTLFVFDRPRNVKGPGSSSTPTRTSPTTSGFIFPPSNG